MTSSRVHPFSLCVTWGVRTTVAASFPELKGKLEAAGADISASYRAGIHSVVLTRPTVVAKSCV